jgi:hypothetical protein
MPNGAAQTGLSSSDDAKRGAGKVIAYFLNATAENSVVLLIPGDPGDGDE